MEVRIPSLYMSPPYIRYLGRPRLEMSAVRTLVLHCHSFEDRQCHSSRISAECAFKCWTDVWQESSATLSDTAVVLRRNNSTL